MRLLAALSLFAASVLSAQSTCTTGFEPPDFALGDVQGQDGWGHLSNSPTGGTIVNAPVQHAALPSLCARHFRRRLSSRSRMSGSCSGGSDRLSLTIFDAAGAQVGTACGSTWETA
ncbi:MAG TPA: hypothetical protein VNI54_13105 [Thermoanaerobaculia bacterium]|nr:hypothetical protein [Thermoanaerobaculia bacterium]